MTDLMEKYNYCGWYVGILNKDTYMDREKETPEFGPFSKKTANRTARFFNANPKMYGRATNKLYAIAISGREALNWEIEKMQEGSWSRNP